MAGLPYLPTALLNLFRKPVTESFPAGEPPKAMPAYRGRIFFDATKCVNCGMCERACAARCMTRVSKPAENGEPGDLEITFTFDMTSCTFCGLCADFCARKAITMTDDYMMFGTKKEDFLVGGTFIKKAPKKPAAPAAGAAGAGTAAPGAAAAGAGAAAAGGAKPKFTPEELEALRAKSAAKKAAAEAARAAGAADTAAVPETGAGAKAKFTPEEIEALRAKSAAKKAAAEAARAAAAAGEGASTGESAN